MEDRFYSSSDLLRLMKIINEGNKKQYSRRTAADLLKEEFELCKSNDSSEKQRFKGLGNYYYYAESIVKQVLENQTGATDDQIQQALLRLNSELDLEEYLDQLSAEAPEIDDSVLNVSDDSDEMVIAAEKLAEYLKSQKPIVDDTDFVAIESANVRKRMPYLTLELMLRKLLEEQDIDFNDKQLESDMLLDAEANVMGDFIEPEKLLDIEKARERLKKPNYSAYFNETEQEENKKTPAGKQDVNFRQK